MLPFFENNLKWVHSLIISIPYQLINYNTNTDNENKVNGKCSQLCKYNEHLWESIGYF